MRISPTLRAAVVICGLALAACQSTFIADPGDGTMTARRPSEADAQRLATAMAGLVYDEHQVRVDPARLGEAGWAGPDELRALLDQAEAILGQGRAIRAIAAFTEAVIAAPSQAEPYEGLARALIREGQSPQALAAYLTALDIRPDWVTVRFDAGATFQRVGRLDDAIEVWHEVVDQEPEHGDAHARLAVGYYYLGTLDLARHHLLLAQELGGAVPTQLPFMLDNGTPPRATVRTGHAAGEAPDDSPVTVGPQVRINVTGGDGGADETTGIAIDARPMQAIAAWNDSRGGSYGVGVGVTLDGGQTWTDLVVDDNPSFCDPLTAGDERTGTLWVGGLDDLPYLGIFVKKHLEDSTDFEPATYAGAADKPWMTAGRRHDDPDSTRMYVAANIDFGYSDDLGQTWSNPNIDSQMSGIGHLPRVGPNGELYIAYWDLSVGVKLQRSFDSAATLSAPTTIATRLEYWDIYDSPEVPGGFRVPPLTYLAVDPNDGTLYCVYFDVTGYHGPNANVDLYLTKSNDQGTTWTTPTVINGDGLVPGDQFFPWIEVDSLGRLHLLFFDTRHTVQSDASSSAYLDAYYSWSSDGGDSWTEHRLTPESFHTGAASGFIGDYLGMGVGHGRAYPVYPQVSGSVHEIMSNMIVWDGIFSDAFESGDTSAWSETVP